MGEETRGHGTSDAASADAAGVDDAVRAPTQRVAAYDVVRVAAMAGVVAIHILAGGIAQSGTVGATRLAMLFPDRVLNDLCVPAFLFLTGALVWRPRDEAHPRSWWRRRFEVVFLPYLVWSLLYLGVQWQRNGLPAGGLAGAGAAAGIALLTGSAWFHLYFPPLLLVVYLLRVPAARLARRPALLLAAAVAAQALLALLFHLVRLPTAFGLLLTNLLTLLPYAAIGAWYAVTAPALRRHVPLVLSAGLAGAAVVGLHGAGVLVVPRDPYTGLPQRILTEVAVGALLSAGTLLLDMWSERYASALPAVRDVAGLSYGVYLAHPLVILALIGVLPVAANAWWSSPAFLVAAYAVVLAATLGLVRLLKATRFTRWTV